MRTGNNGPIINEFILFVSFEWYRSDNTIHIDSDDPGLISSFTIQSLDQQMLVYRVRIYEKLEQEGMEYISTCDYTLSRVEQGS
jgi:hypothetical protein